MSSNDTHLSRIREGVRTRLSQAAELAHREFVKTLGPKALWLRYFSVAYVNRSVAPTPVVSRGLRWAGAGAPPQARAISALSLLRIHRGRDGHVQAVQHIGNIGCNSGLRVPLGSIRRLGPQ